MEEILISLGIAQDYTEVEQLIKRVTGKAYDEVRLDFTAFLHVLKFASVALKTNDGNRKATFLDNRTLFYE